MAHVTDAHTAPIIVNDVVNEMGVMWDQIHTTKESNNFINGMNAFM
jgi:hypothetical protein